MDLCGLETMNQQSMTWVFLFIRLWLIRSLVFLWWAQISADLVETLTLNYVPDGTCLDPSIHSLETTLVTTATTKSLTDSQTKLTKELSLTPTL